MSDEIKKNKDKKRFFKDFKAELKKVIWPTPKQIVNNTIAVITIVLVTAIIVLVLDLAFESINKYGINKLKGIVPEDETIVESVGEENTEGTENSENATEEEKSAEETAEKSNEAENTVQ